MELVEAAQVVQQSLQGLGDGQQLQEPVDDDVEDGQKAEAHVAEVDGQILRLQLQRRANLLRQALEVQLLGVFLRDTPREITPGSQPRTDKKLQPRNQSISSKGLKSQSKRTGFVIMKLTQLPSPARWTK